MRKIDQFTNLYSLQKTLRFRLIPEGETLRHFEANNMLEEDERRAENYSKVKVIIDEYHRTFIERVLSAFIHSDEAESFKELITAYADMYYLSNKNEKDKAAMKKAEEDLRKMIAKALQSDSQFNSLFKQDLIKELLPKYLEEKGDEEGRQLVNEFVGFFTYFTGFSENRKNMYSAEEQSTAISYRCVNDNLPKFLDNARIFRAFHVAERLQKDISDLESHLSGIYGTRPADIFEIDFFTLVLSQEGIQRYNAFIGGYVDENGEKIKGLNEYINLYNQQVGKEDRIPKLKMLYKQILSKEGGLSFVPEQFESDDAVLEAIRQFYLQDADEALGTLECAVFEIQTILFELNNCDLNGIFVKNGLDLTTVCAGAFGYWGSVQKAWESDYDAKKGFKDTETYLESRRKAFKAITSFSLQEIDRLAQSTMPEEKKTVVDWFIAEAEERGKSVLEGYRAIKDLVENPYTAPKRLFNNEKAIDLIKAALDSVKEFEKLVKLLLGTGKDEGKDESFYGELLLHYERVRLVDALYDKVRNYMTQKPYNKGKIKLNFNNPQFLGGWDRNKETDYSAVLLRRNDQYFIAVMAPGHKKSFVSVPEVKAGEETYQKMVYKLLPGPNKMLPKVFFSKKGVKTFNPPKEILERYELGTHKTGPGFRLEDCHALIDYFKSAIEQHPDWSQFGFRFSDTGEYKNIGDFYTEVKNQGYKLFFSDVPVSYVDTLVNEGKLYLFRIFSKDFSPCSKGVPNLHTLYFKMLFSPENLKDIVFKLNGESEMFYRRASIDQANMTVHPKGQPIQNKNAANEKQESTFDYDIIKDRRYTFDNFFIHIPITLNFTAEGISDLNLRVRNALVQGKNNYVIGIDRGERNLLYICVVDSSGKIVEQYSLNEIINEVRGNRYHTDYHALLEQRGDSREKQRKDWKTVESIKELKEGYISQVIHKICELVEKYDAVIAMEDLNMGFKRVRGGKFEKSVYQKFEKMLIDKLNFYADKKKEPEELGSVLHAYQLTNAFESFRKMGKQNGIIFYIPAYLTSKIDPTTGFADLLHPHYESVKAAQEFFGKFQSVTYNAQEDYFEFAFDYDQFPRANADFKKAWTVCTFGQRIRTFRNAAENNEWDIETVELTSSLKALFEKYSIDYQSNLQEQILQQSEKDFYHELISLFALTLQMRNSQTGTDIDYLISPVKNASGSFYNSDDYRDDEHARLPKDADANGAYNIARKVLWAIEQMRQCESDEELKKVKLAITNGEWLEFAQSNPAVE